MSNKPWLANYDNGVPHTIDYPKAPIFHFLEEAARKYPDRACTIFKGAVIPYKEMNALTDHMAAALVELGVKKGDRVGLFMPNTPQFWRSLFVKCSGNYNISFDYLRVSLWAACHHIGEREAGNVHPNGI